jgi:hypothetical protein
MASGKLNKAGELMADWYKGLQAFLASQTFASREEELRATIGYKFVAKTHRLAYGMKATFL